MTISDGVVEAYDPPERVKFCVGLDRSFCSTKNATFTVEFITGSLKSRVKVLFSRLMLNDSMRGGVVSWITTLARRAFVCGTSDTLNPLRSKMRSPAMER